jgi:hypothetical protein
MVNCALIQKELEFDLPDQPTPQEKGCSIWALLSQFLEWDDESEAPQADENSNK